MTESPIRRMLEELIRRERLANAVVLDTAGSVDELFRRIVSALQAADPTGVSRRYRQARLDRVLGEIQRMTREFAPALEKELRSALAPIARDQALRSQNALVATLGTTDVAVRRTPMTEARMRAILTTDPFQGRTLREHTRRLSVNAYDATLQQIRLGMSAEEPIGDIVRRVRGTQRGFLRKDAAGRFITRAERAASVQPRFVGGTLSTTTRDAEALVRTAVNHVSNVGMLETFKENGSVIGSIVFIAVLDDRTTEICLSLDQTAWKPGDPGIAVPPLHWNCRSILVAEPDWEKLGLAPPPEPERVARDLSGVSDGDLARKVSARRRTGDLGTSTRVSSGTTAEQWLRAQRPAVQNKMLGVGKAELFRSGRLSLKDFVAEDYRVLRLGELSEN